RVHFLFVFLDVMLGTCAGGGQVLVALQDQPLPALRKDLLDALEERDRDRSAHAAAVERQNALGAGAEQMIVPRARIGVGGRGEGLAHNPSPPKNYYSSADAFAGLTTRRPAQSVAVSMGAR